MIYMGHMICQTLFTAQNPPLVKDDEIYFTCRNASCPLQCNLFQTCLFTESSVICSLDIISISITSATVVTFNHRWNDFRLASQKEKFCHFITWWFFIKTDFYRIKPTEPGQWIPGVKDAQTGPKNPEHSPDLKFYKIHFLVFSIYSWEDIFTARAIF